MKIRLTNHLAAECSLINKSDGMVSEKIINFKSPMIKHVFFGMIMKIL